MSLPYDPQNIHDEDFTNMWRDNTNTIFDPADLGSLDPNRDSPQSATLEEAQSVSVYSKPLDFISPASTHNVDATIQRGSSLGFDHLSNWVPAVNVYPFQNAFVSNNAFSPMQITQGQHNQPIPGFNQQLSPYNLQYPAVNAELAQDNPFSVYPPLGNDNASNSLPYGHWVIQQAQHVFPPPTLNSHSVNTGYTMNNQYQPDNSRMEISQNSRRGSEATLRGSKVSMNRAAKQRNDPECDPSLVYPKPRTRDSWGSNNKEGRHSFNYNEKGQWLPKVYYNNEQLREYVDNCPKGTVFRVQQAPTQCSHRMESEYTKCRWANCLIRERTIPSGWLRVTFDEFPAETSGGTRDPLLCAGSMHLWCFEQVFDLMEFHLDGRLIPETRQFPFEDRNVTSLEKLTDAGLVRATYTPWFEKRKAFFNMHGKFPVSLGYEDTLSYALNRHHIRHQTPARFKTRKIRSMKKIERGEIPSTIDIHMGNLETYTALTKKTNKTNKRKKLQEIRKHMDMVELPNGGLYSPDTLSPIWLPPPLKPEDKDTETLEQVGSGPRAKSSRKTSSSRRPQAKRCSWRGNNLKKAFVRRHQGQALLPQPPVGSGQDIDMDTRCSAVVVNSNAKYTPPGYFDPLDPVHRTLQSTVAPSLGISIPSGNHQGSLANAYNPNLNQAIPMRSFNTGDRTQLLSSTVALPDARVEQEPGIRDGNLNTSLKASQGNHSYQNETKAIAQKEGQEALKVLGGGDGTSSNDSSQVNGLCPEETNPYQYLTFNEPMPETTQYPVKGNTEAMDNSIALTQMNTDASQPLELAACTESPQVAAVAESWKSMSSFIDPASYGGYSDTDILTLFDDSAATTTDGTNGESRSC
ncbi:hypothetical protein M441DRAFT_444745 [Trichoderma asperellum CBS 433.97]|uniref:Uncharacterized protein n=1 Tax=Trichoderma asperellum (strain ATCC 204424 / CBS 433.97 / NBRC 101777) TaxID=1042311 RepID=A0A2T3ZN01_TRIA4|nr:hypothetical protein M441DRAFT_444745 [Trichoderma asperellum CBS 433.97]PTB46182.1 hypothetical protein M441DRAFT_444745 [Trichoderma asperellum CBS 433.97]